MIMDGSFDLVREAIQYIAGIKDVLDPEDQIRGIEATGLEAWAKEILALKGLPTDPAMIYDKETGDIWRDQPDGVMCGLLPLVRYRGYGENSFEDFAARILIQLDLLRKEIRDGDTIASKRLFDGLVNLLHGAELKA
ncbi:hypothetical protein ACFL45_09550 [Candidatus Neomarinimicrobiota bacterium]